MASLYKNAIISGEMILNPIPVPEKPEHAEFFDNNTQDTEERERIRQEAYEQGYQTGISEQHSRHEEEFGQIKKELGKILDALPSAIAQNRLDLHAEIADIVLLISQQFFIEKQNDTQALSQQINHILSQLNSRQTVELCVHPQELNALQKGLIQLEATHLNGLKIKADESLVLGGFRIKTSHGAFDASIEKQIEQLKEVLLQIRQRGPHATLD